jgi:hypothetical protein
MCKPLPTYTTGEDILNLTDLQIAKKKKGPQLETMC